MTFLIVMGIIIWVLLIVATLIASFGGFDEWYLNAASACVCVLLTGGLITLGINSDIFEDKIPPDGCYQVTRDTDYVPVSAGKGVIVPVPVEGANFIPIGCP